jgi:tetratricopeptide (TPR) repeat protein
MKKRKISMSHLDGENNSNEGNSFPDNAYAGQKLGQYAIMEVEIDNCLKDKETEQFRQTLKKVHSMFVEEEKEIYKPKIKPLYSKIYIYAAVASVALIIGLVCAIYFTSGISKTSNQKIFARYYEPYQNEYITRSDQVTINNLFIAFQAYENHDYKNAVTLFSKVIEADNTLLMAYFYKGISCIEIKNYKSALESLNKVLIDEGNPYFSQANWYAALTLLNLNNTVKAKKHLEWLVKNDRYYGTKAKEILKVLNK